MWVKRSVWVVTAWLKEEDAEGEPLNWTSPYERFYAGTWEEAEKLKQKLLAGEDEYYGDLITDVDISDSPEEVEILS